MYREVLDSELDKKRPYAEVLADLSEVTRGRDNASIRRSLIVEAGRAATCQYESSGELADASGVVGQFPAGDVLADN